MHEQPSHGKIRHLRDPTIAPDVFRDPTIAPNVFRDPTIAPDVLPICTSLITATSQHTTDLVMGHSSTSSSHFQFNLKWFN